MSPSNGESTQLYLLDTASGYDNGRSEIAVGAAIADLDRSSLLVSTKCSRDLYAAPEGLLHREAARSCARLNVDYIDIYWVHWGERVHDWELVAAEMTDLKRSGLIRAYGLSGVGVIEILRACEAADATNCDRPQYVSLSYSCTLRSAERLMFPVAQRLGIAIFVHSTLAKGTALTDDRVMALSSRLGASPLEIAVTFACAYPGVVAALVGTSRLATARQLAAAARAAADQEFSALVRHGWGAVDSYE